MQGLEIAVRFFKAGLDDAAHAGAALIDAEPHLGIGRIQADLLAPGPIDDGHMQENHHVGIVVERLRFAQRATVGQLVDHLALLVLLDRAELGKRSLVELGAADGHAAELALERLPRVRDMRDLLLAGVAALADADELQVIEHDHMRRAVLRAPGARVGRDALNGVEGYIIFFLKQKQFLVGLGFELGERLVEPGDVILGRAGEAAHTGARGRGGHRLHERVARGLDGVNEGALAALNGEARDIAHEDALAHAGAAADDHVAILSHRAERHHARGGIEVVELRETGVNPAGAVFGAGGAGRHIGADLGDHGAERFDGTAIPLPGARGGGGKPNGVRRKKFSKGLAGIAVALLDGLLRLANGLAEYPEFPHLVDPVAGVRGGALVGRDLGERGVAADALKVARLAETLGHGSEVDGALRFGEQAHGGVDRAVLRIVE